MMTVHSNGIGSIGMLVALVGLSLILLVIGLILRRRGHLQSRTAALAWIILVIIPVFVIAPILFLQSQSVTSLGPPEPGAAPGSGDLVNLQ
jgi:hypothetical protein